MKFNKINHVAIICSHYKKSKDFYVKNFTFFQDPDELPIEIYEIQKFNKYLGTLN